MSSPKHENIIIESNSVMKFIRPDVYLTVLDPGTTDFKASALEFLDRASGCGTCRIERRENFLTAVAENVIPEAAGHE